MKKELKNRIISSLIMIPICLFFIIKGSIFFLFFLSVLFIICSYEWYKIVKKNNIIKFTGFLCLLISYYSAFNLRENDGFQSFFLILLICIFTDIGGFIFGNIFKGPKLSKISPNKTYAGMIGGFFLSILAALFYMTIYLEKIDQIRIQEFLFVLIISLVSQVGDLIISFFKRKAKIKDTGKILPGHGGLLDRLDGIIFVFLFLFFAKFII